MRREIFFGLFGLILLFSFSFVLAQNFGNQENAGEGDGGNDGVPDRNRVISGEYTLENGERIQIREEANNRMMISAGNYTVTCDCNLTQEMIQNRTRLFVRLRDGRSAELEILPDAAVERALERLRLRNCFEEEGCNITLKEVQVRNQERVAYEVRAEKESRVLGLFRTRMQVAAQIDAESGEVILVNKPWWAFLASEEDDF